MVVARGRVASPRGAAGVATALRRMRARREVKAVKQRPEMALALEEALLQCAGDLSVSANSVTGRFLVQHSSHLDGPPVPQRSVRPPRAASG